jgi:glutaredoxin
MYYLFIVVLDGCGYSRAAIELLNNFNIKYKSLKINQDEKSKYVTTEINTFPQVYLKKNVTNDTLLLGGYDDLKYFCDIFRHKKYDEQNIIDFSKKYSFWNKKSILRLIEIINLK